MNLPDPRPDEDLCGLIGRIQRFNCFVDFKMTKQAYFNGTDSALQAQRGFRFSQSLQI